MAKKEGESLDNRKLTKAELKRKAEFETMSEGLKAEGYAMHSLTMSALFGNLIALLIMLPIIVLLFAGYIAYNDSYELDFGMWETFIFFIVVIILTVMHECIHGITWSIFAKNHWKSIAFGFIVQYLTPYCNCKDPLKKHEIILGALMPTIVLGIIPAVVFLVLDNALLFLVSIVMIVGGGGDMACVIKVLGYKSKYKDKLYIDHPYELGIVVFEK